MSWVGNELRRKIPFDKVAKDVNPKLCDNVWEYANETFKIPDDKGKKVTLSKGKKIMNIFRCKLRTNYVYKGKKKESVEDNSITPFESYNFLDTRKWDAFVAVVDTEEWKEKSR